MLILSMKLFSRGERTLYYTTDPHRAAKTAMRNFQVLILPGLGSSGPGHWQSLWEAQCGYARVEQADWERPQLADWLHTLRAVTGDSSQRFVLVAHSLACALVAHAAHRLPVGRVAAALLVAPADVDSPDHTPDVVRGFAPMPLLRLPFPATVVASSNDPYVGLDRARHFAASWGAGFVDIGATGHINADSGLGAWDQGQRLLADLLP
jgi:predicted alpha/beta hydrolase family esterase